MNVEEFLKMYRSHTILKEGEDWAIIGLPFFHLGHPDGIAIRFTNKNGELFLSDCRTTTEYLDAENIDLEDYPDKLETIMRKFGLFLDGDVFRKKVYNPESEIGLCTAIGCFIEAICLIAHIDL